MLRVDELCKPIIERAAVNHETYKLLYTQCVEHIKRKHACGCTITLYQVPDFVLGRPPFTHAHAIRYVSEKLRRGKFDVKVDGPVLHIDWEARIREACRKARRTKRTSGPARLEKHVKTKTKEEPLSVRLARLLKKPR